MELALRDLYRATQLTKWKRLRDFISLGVAPALLSTTFVWENPILRTTLFVISGLCSVSSWTWFIFGFSNNWDNQLQLSIDVPIKLRLIIPEIKEEIDNLQAAQQNQDKTAIKQTCQKLKKLIQQVNSLHEDIDRQQVFSKPWMNLLAQQHTMKFHQGKCGSCYQELNLYQIKKVLH
jgi:hypothetical protein